MTRYVRVDEGLTKGQVKALKQFEKAMQSFITHVEENPREMITASPPRNNRNYYQDTTNSLPFDMYAN